MKLAGVEVGIDRPLFLIAGPCVIESPGLTQEIAERRSAFVRLSADPFDKLAQQRRMRDFVEDILAR